MDEAAGRKGGRLATQRRPGRPRPPGRTRGGTSPPRRTRAAARTAHGDVARGRGRERGKGDASLGTRVGGRPSRGRRPWDGRRRVVVSADAAVADATPRRPGRPRPPGRTRGGSSPPRQTRAAAWRRRARPRPRKVQGGRESGDASRGTRVGGRSAECRRLRGRGSGRRPRGDVAASPPARRRRRGGEEMLPSRSPFRRRRRDAPTLLPASSRRDDGSAGVAGRPFPTPSPRLAASWEARRRSPRLSRGAMTARETRSCRAARLPAGAAVGDAAFSVAPLVARSSVGPRSPGHPVRGRGRAAGHGVDPATPVVELPARALTRPRRWREPGNSLMLVRPATAAQTVCGPWLRLASVSIWLAVATRPKTA